MTTVDVFPDSEALVGAALREASIAVIGDRWYSSIPKTPTYPVGTYHRFGGIPTNRLRLDFSRIQIDVWGTSKSEARDIAAEARAVVHAMEGESFTITGGWPDDAFVTAVADDLGLLWLPDPDTARDRYTFGVALTLHAL